LIFIAAAAQLLKSKEKLTLSAADIAIMGLPLLAGYSLLFHWLITNHGGHAYLDNMLHGLVFWLAASSMYFIASSDRTRIGAYIRAIAITAGAAAAAGQGINDYLPHLRNGEAVWREFGNFTDPDFFAGHLVMCAPLALLLFLGAKSKKTASVSLLYVLAAMLQLIAVLNTGSRFAPVSEITSIVISAAGLFLACRAGTPFPKNTKNRILALAVILLIGLAIFARPVTSRLSSGTMKSQASSGNFRLWTWKGTVRLIEANPILGAGPAQFVYAYPKSAITGYTTHAHCAYLQTAADIGVPALILMLGGFGFIYFSGFRSLLVPIVTEKQPEVKAWRKGRVAAAGESVTQSDFLSEVSLIDDRYLIIGLIGAITAGAIQNLIDSDWFNYQTGITLFALAGILASFVKMPSFSIKPIPLKAAGISLYAAAAVLCLFFAAAEFQEESFSYIAADQSDPYNGKFAGNAAMHADFPNGLNDDGARNLSKACRLTPDSVSYYRLGAYLASTNDPQRALECYNKGLEYDPKSLQILMAAADVEARQGDSSDTLGYYLRVAALETSPFGTVRAIPEVSETRFAFADSAIGDILLKRKLASQAIPYYNRVVSDSDEYSDQGGASNGMRKAMTDGVVDIALDEKMRAIYIGALNNLAVAYGESGHPDEAASVKAHLNIWLERFDNGLEKDRIKGT
jgi:tetratricopeptide (TPR) repeat protein